MSQEYTKVNGIMRVCCSLPENMSEERWQNDVYVKTCRVCQRNHYRMKAQGGQYTWKEVKDAAKFKFGNDVHKRRTYSIPNPRLQAIHNAALIMEDFGGD